MTLQELSADYASAAELLRQRLRTLRCRLHASKDAEERLLLRKRIAVLQPMLTEMNALAELTAHYYDAGYYRDEEYTL